MKQLDLKYYLEKCNYNRVTGKILNCKAENEEQRKAEGGGNRKAEGGKRKAEVEG
jgi:hypothetical protein